MNCIILLHSDGVINVNKTISSIGDFEFMPESREGLRKIQDINFHIAIIGPSKLIGVNKKQLEAAIRGDLRIHGIVDVAFYDDIEKNSLLVKCREEKITLINISSSDIEIIENDKTGCVFNIVVFQKENKQFGNCLYLQGTLLNAAEQLEKHRDIRTVKERGFKDRLKGLFC